MSATVIRRAELRDAAAIAQFMADPAVYAQVLQLPFPTEELWRQRLADQMTPGKVDIHLVADRDGVAVGSAGLHAVSGALRRRHVMGLGMTVAREVQGQGVGTALMAALIDYADRWAQVLRVELTVYTDNAAAIALYRKFGFEVEGTMRAYALRDGQYVDAFSMARLHPSPPLPTP